jgi:hypothetical protein
MLANQFTIFFLLLHIELKLFCISTTVLTYYYFVCIILSIMWNLYDGMPLVAGILSVTSFPRYRSSLLLYEATHCYDSEDQNNL